MRALALHPQVLLLTSALLQVNCVIVHGPGEGPDPGETFVIDSPILPDELDALAAVIEQAGFPPASGLLATHGDWDHLLGRLALGDLALGASESTARRLSERPGEAQRELRDFDEELYISRPRPLALGSVQGLPVPGRCEIGAQELHLHETAGHTGDGMAIWIPWARVLVAGDYLSAAEIPSLGVGGGVDAYLATLERLTELAEQAEHVVPGHGPVLDGGRAREIAEEDTVYLGALLAQGAEAQLPSGRRSRAQREVHVRNVQALSG